jgi:hypothetical protein
MSGLYYPQQHTKVLIGTKNSTTFEVVPATLTTGFTDNAAIITTDYHSQMILYIKYTPGAGGGGNSIQVQLEFSADGVNFYKENSELTIPDTTYQYMQVRSFDNNGSSVALTAYNFRIPVEIADKFFRISLKETVVGGSAGIAYAEALLSGK